MEGSNGMVTGHSSNNENTDETRSIVIHNFEMESVEHNAAEADHHPYDSLSALEILRETVRILRYNLTGFMSITAVLICPVSAVILTNFLVNQSLVKALTLRLLLIAKASGLPLKSFIKQSCQKFSEMLVSTAMCFPLFISLSLLSKTAVFYSVDCTYSRKKFDYSKFYAVVSKIWKCVAITYLWVCLVISGCFVLFLVLLISVGSLLYILGFSSDLILYPAMVVGMIFSIILANSIVICNVAIVVSVLEDVWGLQALLRSRSLIKGQTQVGLLLLLGSTLGMAFVEGLFDHRVKTLSYGDGTSRIWEGPLLVFMYSFIALIDSMMSAVFYFSCKSYHLDSATEENQPILEASAVSSQSTDVQ